MTILKSSAEYAAQLQFTYSPAHWHIAAFEACRAHTKIPVEFWADVQRHMVNAQREKQEASGMSWEQFLGRTY